MMDIKPADNTILGLNEPAKWGQAKAPHKAVAAAADSLDQSFKSYIDKALSISESAETVDIAQIRRELKDGLYDSPEMVRAAAEKMLKQGI